MNYFICGIICSTKSLRVWPAFANVACMQLLVAYFMCTTDLLAYPSWLRVSNNFISDFVLKIAFNSISLDEAVRVLPGHWRHFALPGEPGGHASLVHVAPAQVA